MRAATVVDGRDQLVGREPARRGEVDAGHEDRVEDVDVHVHVGMGSAGGGGPRGGEGGLEAALTAALAGPCAAACGLAQRLDADDLHPGRGEALHLARVEVAAAGVHTGAGVDGLATRLRPRLSVRDPARHRQRHAVEEAARRGRRRVVVAVGVEPDDGGRAGAQARGHAEGDVAVATHDDRLRAAADRGLHRLGECAVDGDDRLQLVVEGRRPADLDDLDLVAARREARGQARLEVAPRPERHAGALAAEVVGDAEDGELHRCLLA